MNATLSGAIAHRRINPAHGRVELQEALKRVQAIDLKMVRTKIMDKDEGQGWDESYALSVETKYRRFLVMVMMFPEHKVVPNKEVDVYWHQHILDTRAYQQDCQKTFGYFLHHFPYFGMRGEDDKRNLDDSFEATRVLYLELFGEAYVPDSAEAQNCGTGACAKCGSEHCSS